LIDLGLQARKRGRTVKLKVGALTSSLAMHSSANADWGTPMLLRRFAAAVLRPAAKMGGSIDLDYSTSSYWQAWWPGGDCPRTYLDGSPGKDVLVAADRAAVCPDRGSGFLNPAGLDGGTMVQKCWEIFEQDHAEKRLGSGVWLGFSLEQESSLQGITKRNPLTVDAEDLITTIVPSRRCRYLLHPEQFIAITRKKQAKRDRRSKLWLAEQRKIEKLKNRSNDEPVPGNAPSHASYVTILWSAVRAVRRRQMAAARQFLAEQRRDEKSLLYRFEAIGPMDIR
jgi:Holliday junction resolvase-like predicted endonuclease